MHEPRPALRTTPLQSQASTKVRREAPRCEGQGARGRGGDAQGKQMGEGRATENLKLEDIAQSLSQILRTPVGP